MKITKRQLRRIIKEAVGTYSDDLPPRNFPTRVRYRDRSEIMYTQDDLTDFLDRYERSEWGDEPYALDDLEDVEPEIEYGLSREGLARLRGSIAKVMSEQTGEQTYVAYALIDGPSGPEGTGTAYNEEDEPIGTFKYEAVFEEPNPDMGVTVKIVKLNYTSGPHEGEKVDLDRAVLEDLEEGIIDELPESFFGGN